MAHRLLEEAGRGAFDGELPAEIESRWQQLLHDAEEAASRSWLNRHFVPFSSSVPDFEVRKLQALSAARSLTLEHESAPTSKGHSPRVAVGHEVPVATADGELVGRIDAVIPGEGGIAIRDYKSGAIYEGQPPLDHIKPAYVDQLKLYAAIYAAMSGLWPSTLEIVPIAGDPISIPFSPGDCERLLTEARRLRNEINEIIASGEPLAERIDRLAKPEPTTCGFCMYRPQCPPYARAHLSEPEGAWPTDAFGIFVKSQILSNGRVLLELDNNGETIYIRAVDANPDRHPALRELREGNTLALFSLRRAGGPNLFAEGPFTVIYRTSNATKDD